MLSPQKHLCEGDLQRCNWPGPTLHTREDRTNSLQTLTHVKAFMPMLVTVSPQRSRKLSRFSRIKNSFIVYVTNLLLILGYSHCYGLFLLSRLSFFLTHTLVKGKQNIYSPNLLLFLKKYHNNAMVED